MRRYYIGIDPDTKATGLALVAYDEAAKSFNVLQVAVARGGKGTLARNRITDMAESLFGAILDLRGWGDIDAAAIEWQALRPRGEKNPNSIVDLCGFSGLAAAAVHVGVKTTVLTPTPPEWKGQKDKEVHHKIILSEVGLEKATDLPSTQKLLKSDYSHIMDAVGLAVWAARKMRIQHARKTA